MQIHPITLAFDKSQEEEYQQVFYKHSLPIVRIALLATGLMYGLFAVLDGLIIDPEHLPLFFIIRFAVVVPIILGVVILSYTPVFRKTWQQLIFFASIMGATGIAIMITQVPENGTYYGGLMLVFSAMYFFVRLRFIVATLAGWTSVLIFNLLMILLAQTDLSLLISFNFFYLSANIIGMFATYYIEVSDRRNFYLNKQLNQKKQEMEDINKHLELKVEERTHDLIKSEERFRNLADLLPLIVYEIDTHGIITYANQQAITQLGVSKSEIYGGISVLNFVAPEMKEIARENLALTFQNPGISKGEYLAMRKDGSVFPILDYSSPIYKNDKIVGLRSVVVDLSEHKANEALRTEIAATRQSAEFKQNFLANMSHEIRTPLTGIMGIVEILLSTPLNEEQKEHLSTLRQSTENLREIINQILDYSKIEAGKINVKPVAFETKTIFKNARKYFDSIIQKPVELNISIHNDLPPLIKADINRLQQIISNLISNAVKFTSQGHIYLRARVENWINDQLLIIRIEVEDTGIGIAKEKQELLFQPFTQVDHKDTRHFEGTGLGLTICKELALLLKGEIGVESTGTGSLFWFTFEAALARKGETTAQTPETTRETPYKSLRILLVDDKIINQKVVGLMLTSQGHVVTFANNGQQAVDRYDPDIFDLILMDIQMPVMDGITATRQIRQKHGERPLIVGLSANAFEGDREKYISQGMDDYLTKPVKGADFEEIVRKWFSS
jgi:PAS domain S-box-containing protein